MERDMLRLFCNDECEDMWKAGVEPSKVQGMFKDV